MKFICTKAEKTIIVDALMNNQYCPHPDDNESCVYDNGCLNCIEATIEWQVEDEQKQRSRNGRR